MTPEQIELAQRLVKHPAFWWTPGMSYRTWSDTLQNWRDQQRLIGTLTPDDPHTIPVLTDPATVGCLLALVRGVYKDPGVFVRPRGSKMRPDWVVMLGETSDVVCAAPTEGESLALAILGVV
jgi:hypothetical protein